MNQILNRNPFVFVLLGWFESFSSIYLIQHLFPLPRKIIDARGHNIAFIATIPSRARRTTMVIMVTMMMMLMMARKSKRRYIPYSIAAEVRRNLKYIDNFTIKNYTVTASYVYINIFYLRASSFSLFLSFFIDFLRISFFEEAICCI